MSKERLELLYKVLVVGDMGTGKTALIKKYVHDIFSPHYKSTIGVDFALKVIQWDKETIIRLQLWDIAGQERFGNMTRVYYKEAVGAFIVCDVTRNSTFEAITKWKKDIDDKIKIPKTEEPIPTVLLVNKFDLIETENNTDWEETRQKLDELCKETHIIAWFETSAKTGLNIKNATDSLIGTIIKTNVDNKNDIFFPDSTIDLSESTTVSKCNCN
jgi:small GTP-binding protein